MPPSARDVATAIAAFDSWYHRIELAPGLETPGTHDSRSALDNLDRLGLPKVATGIRVLDIGCRDGFFSFAMEARGAQVVAIDAARKGETGFPIASLLLSSAVEHHVENVYDLDPARLGTFDIVLFLGVVYHLRNPLLAMDRIRSMVRADGQLFVESALSPAIPEAGARPLWEFSPRRGHRDDATSKWFPTLAGLAALVEEAQFTVEASAGYADRGLLRATASLDAELEHFRALDCQIEMPGQPNRTWRETR